MAENKLSNDVEKALESYFNSPIKVYECGNEEDRPKRIQDRPFLRTLPNGHTVYLQKTADTAAQGSFAVSLDVPVKNGSIESNTESSAFLGEMQERFRKVKSNVNLIIIDPDVIRERYTMDNNPRRSLLKSFYEYLYGKMNEDRVAKAIPLNVDDYQSLMEASVIGNSPLSLSVPVKGLGQYSIVISTQPDMPTHEMFTAIPGAEIRMKDLNIGKEHVRDMILLHELGHALDTVNRSQKGETVSDKMLKRHRTESVADCFSVLQTAKKYGNTDLGKLVSDIRIDNSAQGFSYIQRVLQQAYGRGLTDETPDISITDLSGVLRENYEGQKFFASPELKAFIQEHALTNNASAPEAAPKAEDTLNMLQGNAFLYKIAETLGSISSYTTSFCADAAVKTADEKLADGSLMAMSDKEIHKLAEDIVAKEAFSKEQITGLVMGVLSGQPTPEFTKIYLRFKEAEASFPYDQKKEMEMQMRAQGYDVPQPKLSDKEKIALNEWFRRDMAEKIEAKGANREALIDTVKKEKDDARKDDGLYNQYKIALMNQIFIENPDKATDKAKTFGTVRDVLRNIETAKIEETGASAVEAFIKTEIKVLDTGAKAVAMATIRDVTTMTPAEFAKSVTKESGNLKKLYEEEKRAQALAFAIRKDPTAWEIASKSPIIAQRIEEKAKQKHPVWIEAVHLNLGQKDSTELDTSMAEIEGNKKLLAYAMSKCPEVAVVVDKKTLTKLQNEIAPKDAAANISNKKTNRKRHEYTEAGDVQWNRLNKGRSL